jgi:acyl-CoA hydrolase
VNAICPGTIDTAQATRAATTFATERFGGDMIKALDDFAQAQAMKRL